MSYFITEYFFKKFRIVSLIFYSYFAQKYGFAANSTHFKSPILLFAYTIFFVNLRYAKIITNF